MWLSRESLKSRNPNNLITDGRTREVKPQYLLSTVQPQRIAPETPCRCWASVDMGSEAQAQPESGERCRKHRTAEHSAHFQTVQLPGLRALRKARSKRTTWSTKASILMTHTNDRILQVNSRGILSRMDSCRMDPVEQGWLRDPSQAS